MGLKNASVGSLEEKIAIITGGSGGIGFGKFIKSNFLLRISVDHFYHNYRGML
jgi:hypothetical protein